MKKYFSVFVFQDVTPLQIVYPDTALRLQALLDFEEENGEKRVAGDEWLFEGPGDFSPSCSLPFLSQENPAFNQTITSITLIALASPLRSAERRVWKGS